MTEEKRNKSTCTEVKLMERITERKKKDARCSSNYRLVERLQRLARASTKERQRLKYERDAMIKFT